MIDRELNACTGIDKAVIFKDKQTAVKWTVGLIDDEVSVVTGGYKHVWQRIRLAEDVASDWGTKYAYRSGYWTRTAKTRRLVWGQFHQLVSGPVFAKLIQLAYKKKWAPFAGRH